MTRGRRPGRPETRELLLEIARRRFMAEGYAQVTLRSIAVEAAVDVALISYYFGSKKGLFGAVLGLVANPPEVFAMALRGDPAAMPQRVLRALLDTWDDPVRGGQLLVLTRAAVADPELTRLLREMVGREMAALVADELGGPGATQRAAAFVTQLSGLIFARYILGLEPVASMASDELIRHLSPGLHATLRPASGRAGARRAPSGQGSPADSDPARRPSAGPSGR